MEAGRLFFVLKGCKLSKNTSTEKRMQPDFGLRFDKEIYQGDAFELARQHLLGAYLCTRIDGVLTAGMITELEVYIGSCDKACHAWPNKLTPRTATMFKPGGCAYVFFVYGMYNQFNVVAGPEGTANAILIRALEPIAGIEEMMKRRRCEKLNHLTTGPGKLCQALAITRRQHDGIDLNGDTVWISPGIEKYEFEARPRIGIYYAEEYKDMPWRFYIRGNSFISKK